MSLYDALEEIDELLSLDEIAPPVGEVKPDPQDVLENLPADAYIWEAPSNNVGRYPLLNKEVWPDLLGYLDAKGEL